MNKKKNSRTTLFVDEVDPNVKREFKAACSKRGKSMKTVIKNLMVKFTKWVEQEELKKAA